MSTIVDVHVLLLLLFFRALFVDDFLLVLPVELFGFLAPKMLYVSNFLQQFLKLFELTINFSSLILIVCFFVFIAF